MVQNWQGMWGFAFGFAFCSECWALLQRPFCCSANHTSTLDLCCLDNILWSSLTVLTKTSKVILVLHPSCRCGAGGIWCWRHLKNWLSCMLRIVLSHVAAGNSAEIWHLTSSLAHCMDSDSWKKWPKSKSWECCGICKFLVICSKISHSIGVLYHILIFKVTKFNKKMFSSGNSHSWPLWTTVCKPL